MKLLTKHQAEEIIAQATSDIAMHPNLRWGQQLWNLLPSALAMNDMNNNIEHYTWYNSHDFGYCLDRFYEEFVEK